MYINICVLGYTDNILLLYHANYTIIIYNTSILMFVNKNLNGDNMTEKKKGYWKQIFQESRWDFFKSLVDKIDKKMEKKAFVPKSSSRAQTKEKGCCCGDSSEDSCCK